MKILHVFDHSIPLHSGYTFRSMSILKEQKKLGWKTYHITGPKHGKITAVEENINDLLFYRSEPLSALQLKIPLLNQWLVIRNLKKRLFEVTRTINPDIIHAHSPALNGLAAIDVAKSCDIPLVYEIRAFWEDAAVDHGTSKEKGWRYKLTKALETYVIKKANAVTTICAGLKNDIISRGISDDKITIIPNAVDVMKFTTSNPRDLQFEQKYALKNKQTLGFVGSFYAYEGLSLLVSALPAIIKKNPDTKLILVGGGPEEDNLKAQVALLNLHEYVVFCGRVPHEQVQKYYDLIDLLVYPRLSMRLTDLVTPLKPLEAMAQKKLFIASDVGGHKELIRNECNGFLFKCNQEDDLVNKINQLISNLSIYEHIRENGRHYVETERNWTVSVSNYQQIYTQLLEK